MLAAIGRWSFVNRRIVAVAWLVAVVGLAAGAMSVGSGFEANPSSPDSDSTEGLAVMQEHFEGFGGNISGSIVFRAPQGVDDPAVQAEMTELFATAEALAAEHDLDMALLSPYEPGVPAISTEGEEAGRVAFATMYFAEDTDFSAAAEFGGDLADIDIETEGLTVEYGGAVLAEFEPPSSEMIGLAFAVVVLILSFGSVLAMGLPIGVALAGVGTGIAVITLASNVTSVPEFATTIGAMIGLGVGIDYALFIVTRYREALHDGHPPLVANVIAIDTAGRSVIFAGMTVVISLLGMLIMGLPFVNGLGISAAITVLLTMVASITLLPAFIGFAGRRIEVTRVRGLLAASLVALALLGTGLDIAPLTWLAPLAVVVLVAGLFVGVLQRELPPRRQKPVEETFWFKWSHLIQAHPWRSVVVAVVLLGFLAVPLASLRLGFSDESNYGEDTTTRRAYDLLADGFGPGFNGPLIVTFEYQEPGDAVATAAVAEAIAGTAGVASTVGPIPDDPANPDAAVLQVYPTTGPQDEATADLLTELREDVIPEAVASATVDVKVTGRVAASADFTDYLAQRLVVFIGVVLSLSFLLLMVVFRSLLVPLKAVAMNLLSIASAYGVVVAVFQWGWLGLVEPGPIEPFIPMMLFAIVFGLSMDYEVFLLSRIKEDFDRTGDAVNSVANGLASTARVITAAAAIMIVVFGSFVLEDDRVVKLFGTGLATAVLLDATLVRMLLVPATMELLGARNWWLPRWLDRLLPTINVEGDAAVAARTTLEEYPDDEIDLAEPGDRQPVDA